MSCLENVLIMNRINKIVSVGFVFVFSILIACESVCAGLVIHSRTAVKVELISYNGLTTSSLFKGSISAGSSQKIDTSYHGHALLIFKEGQSYPVIIGDDPLILKITDPAKPPSFSGSGKNEFFYSLLSGTSPKGTQYPFTRLMIQAKQLLESSHSVHTIKELTAKKKESHEFVASHYESLKHSDMVRRLLAQYFMMHEYVDYHTEGAPATAIRVQYQKAVLNGVGSWLEILKPHIPEHEILNYCVSLYYNRSMVTLAALIIDNFREVAYCPGGENKTFSFPGDILITEVDGNRVRQLDEIKGNKIIAFVSDDCPVSMIEAIIKERQLADQKKDVMLIVAPLQQLSEKHLAMSRMVSGGNMLFISDEKWRNENLVKEIRLPLFVRIGNTLE